MNKNIVKKILLGTDIRQEYLCIGLENFPEKFKAFASFQDSSIMKDITEDHVFLGYRPLVIGLSVKKADPSHEVISSSKEICISLQREEFHLNDKKHGFPIDRKSDARLILKQTCAKDLGNTSFFLFEGIKGEHHFLSSFHQLTNRLLQNLRNKGANNVGLPGNLYEQVRIAYSFPRIISIISLGKDNLYNMFPTDLHGSINDEFYASSLRHGGKACKQVEEIKEIVISNVSVNAFRDAYDKGRNHMQDLKGVLSFNAHTIRSERFNYPLDPQTISYHEMELIDSVDVGIHRIFFYKKIHQKILNHHAVTLAHVHQYYEAWRKRKGIKTETFMR